MILFDYGSILNTRELFDDFICVKRYGCCKPTWVLDA